METKGLMVEFYGNIQSGKMSRCQALRQAALREMKIIKERMAKLITYSGVLLCLWESLDSIL